MKHTYFRWTVLFTLSFFFYITGMAEDAQVLNPLYVEAHSRWQQISASSLEPEIKASFGQRFGDLAREQQKLWGLAGQVDRGECTDQCLDSYNDRVMTWQSRLQVFSDNAKMALGLPEPGLGAQKSLWPGNWDKTEKASVQHALSGFKDERLSNWISANVQFKRTEPDGVSALSVSNSELRFKDDFFSKATTDAGRENLIAFEAGKAFWNSMKDKPVEGGKTLQSWFNDLHSSVFSDMKRAKHGGESLDWVADPDTASQFAHIFRAQALQLDKPKEQKAQQEWDRVMREFQTHIVRILPGK